MTKCDETYEKHIQSSPDRPGECKQVMMDYLGCIKKVKGMNDNECRNIAKSYLSCRMDR